MKGFVGRLQRSGAIYYQFRAYDLGPEVPTEAVPQS